MSFLNPRDEFHQTAVEFIQQERRRLVTTHWVIVELGNFVAKWRVRHRFASFVHDLRADPQIEIDPLSENGFEEGLELYDRRPDKRWSMTDCLSFVVMRERGLIEALTTDHHFVQAGFKILLK